LGCIAEEVGGCRDKLKINSGKYDLLAIINLSVNFTTFKFSYNPKATGTFLK